MKTAHLKNSLIRICAQPRTLEYITNKMGGLDPVKISVLLNELKNDCELFQKDEYWSVVSKEIGLFSEELNSNSELPLKKYMGHFDFLKTPHPLDFEWRNTLKSLNFLADLIAKVNGVNDKVLILGMPTLFATCSLRNITQKISLIERNRPIARALSKFVNEQYNVQEKDIFHAKPESIGKFYSVFMDPPWYSNFLYQFIWLGARCLELGGVMVISIPPINTRSNVDKERVEWFTFCQKQGLCIEKLEPEKLEYAMPFFEYNAFRTAGTSHVQPFWRKGDLVFFRKVSESNESRPKLNIVSQNWKEKEFGNNIRIRVNMDSRNEENEELRIESLTKTDILASVKRSEELREEANVWTSGNRIFRTNCVKTFWNGLNSSDVQLVNEWLEMIIDLENKEYKEYLTHIYYEMERQTT